MPDSQDFPRRIVQELEARVERCVVPLLVSDMGAQTMHACATGTLFQIADQHFLVTAAHVFEQAKEHFDSRLFTSDYRAESPTVPLSECTVHHYTHAAIDVAVFELTDLVLSQIPKRVFLGLALRFFPRRFPQERGVLRSAARLARRSSSAWMGEKRNSSVDLHFSRNGLRTVCACCPRGIFLSCPRYAVLCCFGE